MKCNNWPMVIWLNWTYSTVWQLVLPGSMEEAPLSSWPLTWCGSLHGLDDGLFGLHCLGWLHGLGALHGQFWLLCLHGLPGLGILDQLAPWGFGSLQLVQIGFGENPLDVALVLVCPQHGAPHGHSKQWKDFTTDLEVGVAHCFQNILANLELDVEPCIKRSIVASPRGTWIISGSSNLLSWPWPLGAVAAFFIDILFWLVFSSSSGPQLVSDLVEWLGCRSQLQPVAATMVLNQIGRHWVCFAIIAANGYGCLDVNLHVRPWAK